jgi:tetratricopeptide (TPR) repeat protein
MLMEGLCILRDQGQGYVASISKKIIQHLESSKKLSQLIENEIIKNEQSMSLFMDAVDSFYDCGDFHQEQCVISVMLALFPLNPQPYVYLGTLIWRRDGIAVAEHYYEKIVKVLVDPALDYFAADCFFKNGNKDQAKELLQRALDEAKKAPEMYQDTKPAMLALLEKC